MYPDLDKMSQLQLDEFISCCPLPEWQKSALWEEKDKNTPYTKYIDRYKFNDARSKAVEAYSFTIKNGIFLPNDIRTKFTVIHDLIWKALNDHRMIVNHEQLPDHIISRLREFPTKGEDLMKELERLVHERIWPADEKALKNSI
jgi:hypothetical protein